MHVTSIRETAAPVFLLLLVTGVTRVWQLKYPSPDWPAAALLHAREALIGPATCGVPIVMEKDARTRL